MALVLPKLRIFSLFLLVQAWPLLAFSQSKSLASSAGWTVDAQSESGALRVLDRNQHLVRRYPLATLDGKYSAQGAEVFHAAARQSFVIAPIGLNELWELSYRPDADPIYDGYVHDYKMGEGIAKTGFLGLRRTPLDEPLQQLIFDENHRHAIGTTLATATRAAELQVINMDVRRRIERIALPAAIPSGTCHAWQWRAVSGRYCAP